MGDAVIIAMESGRDRSIEIVLGAHLDKAWLSTQEESWSKRLNSQISNSKCI